MMGRKIPTIFQLQQHFKHRGADFPYGFLSASLQGFGIESYLRPHPYSFQKLHALALWGGLTMVDTMVYHIRNRTTPSPFDGIGGGSPRYSPLFGTKEKADHDNSP